MKTCLRLLMLFTLLASSYHVGLAFIGGTLGYPSMHECAIGFSGVIFGVIVVDTLNSSLRWRAGLWLGEHSPQRKTPQ